MHNLNWDDLRICLSVVKAGSVTAAARQLGINHTTVSRRITELERNLGVGLFDRSTAGWQLSPVGESLIRHLEQMSEEAFAIRRLTSADSQELRGKLRITAVDQAIQRLLLPGLKSFRERFPEISIDLIASPQVLDLATHEADIAYRLTNDPPPNVVGKRICELRFGLYCHRDILPLVLNEPARSAAIAWEYDGQEEPNWLRQLPGMPVRFRVNNGNVCYDLLRSGLGVGELSCALGDMDPSLVRVPVELDDAVRQFWMLTHVDLRTTARIRIFRDHMDTVLEPLIPLLQGERPEAWRQQPAGLLPAAPLMFDQGFSE